MRAVRAFGAAATAAIAFVAGPSFADERVPLAEALATIRAANPVPALGALVSRRGRVVDIAVVGVRKQGEPAPATVDDPFHLGSDTKAMTATLVAMLVDDGRLSWTSTVRESLPDLSTTDPAFADVTIEMLLAHRSGLGSEGSFERGELFARLRAPGLEPMTGRRMVAEAMLSAPPEVAPGTAFRYSNANYLVAGHVVERLAGRSWETLLTERLFRPLGMTSCGFGALGAGVHEPWGHRQADGGLVPVLLDNPATLGPAGTVHCAMADWMKFVQLHLDAYNGRPRLASAAAFAKLHARVVGQDYTVGGWIRTERPWAGGTVFTHDGSNTLNYATVWWAPAIDAAALAVDNAGPPTGRKAAQEAVGAALRAGGLL